MPRNTFLRMGMLASAVGFLAACADQGGTPLGPDAAPTSAIESSSTAGRPTSLPVSVATDTAADTTTSTTTTPAGADTTQRLVGGRIGIRSGYVVSTGRSWRITEGREIDDRDDDERRHRNDH